MVSIDRSDEQNPFSADVVAAVLDHMNADHLEDSVAIVATYGGRPDATSAVMVGIDGTGGDFDVEGPEGPARVRVPWSGPISERAEIRAELARMANEADAQASARVTGTKISSDEFEAPEPGKSAMP